MQISGFKRSDVFLLILALFSLGLYLWQQFGMNLRLQIDPVANTPFLFDDNDYGGTSISNLTLEDGYIEFSCDTKPTTFTFPFCSVNIPLYPAGAEASFNISDYDEIKIALEFSSELRDTVLVYLQNDETGFDGNQVIRANMSILTPENEYKEYRLPLDDFFLPSWWVFDHLGRVPDFEPKFDNVRRIQISTGDSRIPRTIMMRIHSIELTGKWINDDELFTLLVAIWSIYVLVVIAFKVAGLSKSRQEAADKAQELKDLNEALEQAANAKDMFLANMSHEIRTPMNGIYGSLQLLTQRDHNPEDQELIDRAITSTRTLLTIVNDILDFSKIEANKLQLESTPFSLKNTIDSIVSDFQPAASEKGLTLNCEYDDNLWDNWEGDPVRIKQVLLNLMSNAIKFTQQGSVKLSVVTSPHKNSQSMNDVLLTVTDTGIGMSDNAIAKLFSRFEQADNSTTRKYGGTGLGMSITYSLVELMNGTINVESVPNEGSSFTVKLPLHRSKVKPQDIDSNQDIRSPIISDSRILIAEDNPVNMVLLKKMLADSQATIYEAHNGAEAIELCRMYQPDLIFMDIQMPIMDGKDACMKLKSEGFQSPIIAFTANVLEHEVAEYSMAGFDGHLAKPVEINKLYALLEDFLTNLK